MSSISNKIDLVVSFDTTGSMYPVLAQVRTEVEKFVKQMFSEFTDLRLGIIAHGDYCDAGNPYTIISKDFTRDETGLCDFVHNVKKTYGGDADECYELVLNTARTQLSWRDDADKLMIMIGDASPHGVYYRDNKDHLDWEEESKKLAAMGIKVFAVHALSYYRSSSKAFYKTVAKITDGTYLTLDQFNEVVNLIKATCYQQGGEEKLNEFITIIRDKGEMTNSMDRNFRRLLGEVVEEETYTYSRPSYSSKRKSGTRKTKYSTEPVEVTIKDMGKLVPVMPGRFQIMTVDENCDIRGFVTKNGIEFEKGRGFYELSKAETVQQYKEVIMMDRETGEMFNGSQVREELGLQPQSEKGGVKERLHKDATKKFRVFVQSTSVNRKLIAGTTFLYEVSDIEDTGTVIEARDDAEDLTAPVEVKETKKSDADKKLDELGKKADELIKKVDDIMGESAEEIDAKLVAFEKKADEIITEVDAVEEELRAPETTESVFTEVESIPIVTEADIKREVKADAKKSKAVKKEAKPVDKEKVKAEKEAAKKKVKVEKAIGKVNDTNVKLTDALARYQVSQNKKNKEYLCNNIKRFNKALDELSKLVEE